MRTAETFYSPGLEDPEEVIRSLPEVPRPLHLVGKRISMIWRLLVFALSVGICAYLEYILLTQFVNEASLVSLMLAAAALPIFLAFVPWWLFSSFKKCMISFDFCKRVYENGTPCIGAINTLTKITGRDMETYHFGGFHAHGHVRVDYTFEVENDIKVGTVILSATSARYLNANDRVCVIYMPENTSESILFPIPGSELLEVVRS